MTMEAAMTTTNGIELSVVVNIAYIYTALIDVNDREFTLNFGDSNICDLEFTK